MTHVEQFRELLNIYPANNKKLRESAFRIRYQVYCKEIGFNGADTEGIERETDEYDKQSRHCLLIHKPTNRPIGCARLIMADPLRPELPLPFEKYWLNTIDKNLFDPDEFLPGQVVEFSRIAVIEEFRRKNVIQHVHPAGNRMQPLKIHSNSNSPVIPLSLFLASLSMLISSDAEYGFAMMEPKLARLLRRFGIIFEQVGEGINHFGWRSPFIIHRDNVLRYFKRGVGDLFFEINKSLETTEEQRLLQVV